VAAQEEETIKNADTFLIIQEFAGQVKNINAERIKPPRLEPHKPNLRKGLNARQKALDYSKNVPKPLLKRN
jgi:hypothetical protein